MAQKTAWTGAVLTESDINTYLMHEGGAWSTYTPTLTQSATPTKTVTIGRYARIGRTIVGTVSLAVTSSGTAANAVLVGLPVASIAYAVNGSALGVGTIFDTSASSFYTGALIYVSTTTAAIYGGGGVASALGITQFTAAIASGDVVTYNFCYEAAT